jgi:hypothetical protein
MIRRMWTVLVPTVCPQALQYIMRLWYLSVYENACDIPLDTLGSFLCVMEPIPKVMRPVESGNDVM